MWESRQFCPWTSSNSIRISLIPSKFVLPELVEASSETETVPTVHVVQNWYEEFRDREQD